MEIKTKHSLLFSRRLFLAIFSLIGFALFYSQRTILSIAIIAMVNQTALLELSNKNESEEFIIQEDITKVTEGSFIWDETIQGQILSSFFYGYFISQVPAGWLAEQYGCKKILFISMGISSIATIVIPSVSKIGDYVPLIILRVIAGIGSGAIFPCISLFWSKWSPQDERSILTCFSYSGCNIGIITSMSISGLLCSTLGWESVFYISGGSTCIWLFFWYIFVSDSPSEDGYISDDEKFYIISNTSNTSNDSSCYEIHQKTPWISILTSPIVWGLAIVTFAADWGLYTYITNIPSYLNDVMSLDITSNGYLSSLPFVGSLVVLNIAPYITDNLISKQILSIRSTRVLMTTIGCVGAALMLLALSCIDPSNKILAIIFLILGVSLADVSVCGYLVSPLDIAPKFSGTIMGLTNMIGAISGFLAPTVIALLTENHSIYEWKLVFYITATLYVVGAITFAIFCKGEEQNWANDSKRGEYIKM